VSCKRIWGWGGTVFWALFPIVYFLNLWARHGGEHGLGVVAALLGCLLATGVNGVRVGLWLARRGPCRSPPRQPEPTLFKLWQGGSEAARVWLVERARDRSVETTIEEAPRAPEPRSRR
jgi:hypothetical protein